MANLSVNTPFVMKFGQQPSCSGHLQAIQPNDSQLNVTALAGQDVVPLKTMVKDDGNDVPIFLDVGIFTPNELTVTIENDHLVVEGKHEENQADEMGFVYRHFIRRYELPAGYNSQEVVSELSANGVVNIIMPKTTVKPKEKHPNDTVQTTGQHDVF